MDTKLEFTLWIEKKINSSFPIKDNLLLAFLNQAIESFENLKINGVHANLNLLPQEFSLLLLRDWISTARLFLELPDTGVVLNFRGNQIPQAEQKRISLLNQLILLESQCL